MEKVTIAKVSTQIRGVSYKPNDLHDSLDQDSVILLRANNIDDGKINFDDVVFVDKRRVTEEQYLKKGDILICASSGSKNLVGKAAYFDLESRCTFGAFCKVVRPTECNPEYLSLYFRSDAYRRKIMASAIGANINNIRNEHIDSLEINIYPEVENEIICKIQTISHNIERRKSQLQELDTLIKARFVEMFGDTVENPYGWEEATLDTLSDIVSGITKGRKTKVQDLIEVPYMAVSNVKDGYIDWTTVKTIFATNQEIEQYRLMPNDVLMTEGGDPDKVGRGAILKNTLDNCIHQNHIFRVRLNRDIMMPEYFAEYLQHQKAKQYFLGCAKQTTGIASINMKQLRALPVLLPPHSRQEDFTSFVTEVDKSKAVVQKALDEAQLLFDSLMQEYFG